MGLPPVPAPTENSHEAICSFHGTSASHAVPWPVALAGLTARTTAPTSSSVSCASPPAAPSRTSPAASPASTYRRAVLRSTPARSAAVRSPAPASQARRTT